MVATPDVSEMSEEELFGAIGRSLLAGSFGSNRLSDPESERAGRAWFNSVLPVLRRHVCGNPTIEKLLLNDVAAARNAALVAAVEACLTGLFHQLPVATIANALVCYGIRKLCEGCG